MEGRGCLSGSHYKLGDAFPRQEIAQGCELLVATRLLPVDRRGVLHAALVDVQGAWWWMITPDDDAGSERRSIISTVSPIHRKRPSAVGGRPEPVGR